MQRQATFTFFGKKETIGRTAVSVSLFIGLFFSLFFFSFAKAGTLELEVVDGLDDLNVMPATGGFWRTWDFIQTGLPHLGKPMHSAARFTNVTVPQGSIITNAYISLMAYSASDRLVNTIIYAEATDTAARITNLNDFWSRSTTSGIVWDISESWEVGDISNVDISSEIRAVINRPGWQEGNAINIFWMDNGTYAEEDGYQRAVYSFEGYQKNTSTRIPPKLYIEYVPPCQVHNVSGFAWSKNIGWISASCRNTMAEGTGVDYGLDIDSGTGQFSGYAWSSNIGWINFNPGGDFVTYPGCGYPSSPCNSVRLLTGEVSGWARAVEYDGDWDGWMKMRCDGSECTTLNYGVSYSVGEEFNGFAWGDDVVGWISFNSKNCDPNGDGHTEGGVNNLSYPNCPDDESISDYKVIYNQSPQAAFSCDSSQCPGGECNGSWVSFEADANPSSCNYTIMNNSTDTSGYIATSTWSILPASDPYMSCAETCDLTIPVMPAGDYQIKLNIEDAGDLSDEVNNNLAIREEVRAGFMCSTDDSIWVICESLSGNVASGTMIYLKDDSSLSEYSIPSEGASIQAREWMINGNPFDGNSTTATTTLSSVINTIRLTVTDSAPTPRSDYEEKIIVVILPLPTWEETLPF